MAEFTEVCRQAFRKTEVEGGKKPIYTFLIVSATGQNEQCYTGSVAVPPEELEKKIMQWAAEHPEPKYPTWEEYGKEWKQKFPEAESTPCLSLFVKVDCGEPCASCRAKPIPADIAEKLNIKPIGGDTDAEQH